VIDNIALKVDEISLHGCWQVDVDWFDFPPESKLLEVNMLTTS
jgi:hypothetical protein